jgi:hypothetical protein
MHCYDFFKGFAMKTPQGPAPSFHPGRHLEIFDGAATDPFQQRGKYAEPTVCSDCSAVYQKGRWQWSSERPQVKANRERCPACARVREDIPAGYLTIKGVFAKDHRDEVMQLLRHHEEREKKEHPLQRIMQIDEQPDVWEITTTDIHLVRGLGEAREHAYRGALSYHYNKDDYMLRVLWER